MYDYNASVTVIANDGPTILSFVVALADNVLEATNRAIAMVMKSEGCPDSAITAISVTRKD